jgi:hypothetical protein
VPTTDVNDNWDRTEVTEGVDDVGSGAGQEQVCGSSDLSSPLPVDFARSSKPIISTTSGGCSTEVQTGYAKDSVPIIDYPINPSVYGTSTFTGVTSFPTGTTAATYPDTDYAAISGGVIGPVSEGWEPGDPVNGPYSGTALASISNADGGASNNSGGVDSTAYRIWCSSDEGNDAANRIIDWGQLTNLGPNLWVDGVSANNSASTITASSVYPSEGQFPSTVANGDAVTGSDIPSGTTVLSGAGTGTLTLSNAPTTTQTTNVQINTGGSTLNVGAGAPVGVAIRAIGLNTASGTEATFAAFANSGQGSTGACTSNMNTNDQLDPNTATATGDDASRHVALENNSDQLDQFAAADFPSPDFVDQAIEVATTLYIESNGVFNTNPYAAASTIDGTSYSGNKVEENGVIDSTTNELGNKFPTARTLFNIYNSNTVRASTGGFLNWICDSNSDFLKGLDNSTGLNFDNEVTTVIATTNGFPRLSDVTPNPAIVTPADGIANPNNSGDAQCGWQLPGQCGQRRPAVHHQCGHRCGQPERQRDSHRGRNSGWDLRGLGRRDEHADPEPERDDGWYRRGHRVRRGSCGHRSGQSTNLSTSGSWATWRARQAAGSEVVALD